MDGAGAGFSIATGGDEDIVGLTADSREVAPGFLFAALPGSRTDGRRFVEEAIARGAVAVLTDDAGTALMKGFPVRVITDNNPRRRLALMAAYFFRPQPATVVAVTGTNGKTSVTFFVRQIWEYLKHPAASLGTIGIRGPNIDWPGSLTTPDAVTLHRELGALKRAGIDHVALEASSHGLDQFRLDGLDLSAAAFTNLSRDHLDYHSDMTAYFNVKARLFMELLPPGGTAVLNADVPEGARLVSLCKDRGKRIISFGAAPSADLRLIAAQPVAAGQAIRIDVFGEQHDLILPLIGTFQVSNALAALGLALATGAGVLPALDAMSRLVGAPGRLEHVATHPNGAPVIVDYAHTPDALETVLTAIRPHCRGRLVTVFGCGGDRDPGKRPQMGEIAHRLADIVIITDDNPRSEDPYAIRRAILTACPKATEIADRSTAIQSATALLGPDDLLLIAGKGHERGQIIGGTVLPFNDADVARSAAAIPKRGSQ